GIWLGRALFALPPAPASCNYQARFIGKNDLAWLWMIYFSLAQRCVALRAIGKVDGDCSLHGTAIEDGDGQRIANADQVTEINQQIDRWYIPFLGQTSQQGFSSAAILGGVHVKATKSAPPRG